MAQGVIGFQYDAEKTESGLTALGGLPLYLELAHVSGLIDAIRTHLSVRTSGQGWTDAQVVLAIVLLNLVGGESVSDLEVVEQDEGFCAILRRAELHGLPRPKRRELELRWRKEKEKRRTVPSQSVLLRYLAEFHDAEQEKFRVEGKAFIPAPNENLRAFGRVNRDFVAFVQGRDPRRVATLDVDATLIETFKKEALHCYKGFKAYQPLNVWWAEQELVLFTEFRDGNVPAGFELLRVLKEALDAIPKGVEKIRVRSDTAAYQHDLLEFLGTAHPKFGSIEFAIGCDVTPEFKKAVAQLDATEWNQEYEEVDGVRVKSKREWAEVPFVSNRESSSKNKPSYRYLATRELMEDQPLPGMEEQQKLPFQTMSWNGRRYKVFGIVTNFRRPQDEIDAEMDRLRKKTQTSETEAWSGEKVIHWLYERCGKSEEAHAVMKHDLAGGRLPSGDFGNNAAWWWMMILAFNLNAAMKRLVLGGNWVTKRLKAIRFHLIHIAGCLIRGANYVKLRVSREIELLLSAREKLKTLHQPCRA